MLVSNTSTLVLLAKIGCLETFMGIAPKIEIPTQVKKEALFKEGSYDARLIDKLIKEKRIGVLRAESKKLMPVLAEFRLDLGEAAAYAIFDPKKHDALLTDDGELIKLCRLRGIPFINALSVVIRLYERKKLTKQNAYEKLEELRKIGRYSESLYQHFKNEVH